jgi:hypothetical protein
MKAGPDIHLCIAYFQQEVPLTAYEGLSETRKALQVLIAPASQLAIRPRHAQRNTKLDSASSGPFMSGSW